MSIQRPNENPCWTEHPVIRGYLQEPKLSKNEVKARQSLVEFLKDKVEVFRESPDGRGPRYATNCVPIRIKGETAKVVIDGENADLKNLKKLKTLPPMAFRGNISIINMPSLRSIKTVGGLNKTNPRDTYKPKENPTLVLNNNKQLSEINIRNVDLHVDACKNLTNIRLESKPSHNLVINHCNSLKDVTGSGAGLTKIAISECGKLEKVTLDQTNITKINAEGLKGSSNPGIAHSLESRLSIHRCVNLKNINFSFRGNATRELSLDVSIRNQDKFKDLEFGKQTNTNDLVIENCQKLRALPSTVRAVENLKLTNVGKKIDLRGIEHVTGDVIIKNSVLPTFNHKVSIEKDLTLERCKKFTIPNGMSVQGNMNVPKTTLSKAIDDTYSVNGLINNLSTSERMKGLRGKSTIVERPVGFKWNSNPVKWPSILKNGPWKSIGGNQQTNTHDIDDAHSGDIGSTAGDANSFISGSTFKRSKARFNDPRQPAFTPVQVGPQLNLPSVREEHRPPTPPGEMVPISPAQGNASEVVTMAQAMAEEASVPVQRAGVENEIQSAPAEGYDASDDEGALSDTNLSVGAKAMLEPTEELLGTSSEMRADAFYGPA